MFLVKNDTLVSYPYLIWIETDRVIFDLRGWITLKMEYLQ